MFQQEDQWIAGDHIMFRKMGLPLTGFVGSCSCGILSQWSVTGSASSDMKEIPKSEILFLGTGSSMGTPVALHLMNPDHTNPRTIVSRLAAEGDPRNNKNYRCNPCILVRHRTMSENGGKIVEKNILVDMGKTFRESAVRWFLKHKVHAVDAVILTHGHADAIFGLDDIRSVQNLAEMTPMDVYLSAECLKAVKQVFFYLFPCEPKEGETSRHVSSVNWCNISAKQRFVVSGTSLNVLPFEVMHGEDMKSMGFIFGTQSGSKVCYISDISRMLPDSMDLIQQQGKLSLLIVDALLQDKEHPTHYSVEQAVELCRLLRPKRALLVGMGSQLEHNSTNKRLRNLLSEEGLDVQLAHDGMCCDVYL